MLYRCTPTAVYHAANVHDILLANPFAGCQQAVCVGNCIQKHGAQADTPEVIPTQQTLLLLCTSIAHTTASAEGVMRDV